MEECMGSIKLPSGDRVRGSIDVYSQHLETYTRIYELEKWMQHS